MLSTFMLQRSDIAAHFHIIRLQAPLIDPRNKIILKGVGPSQDRLETGLVMLL